VKDHINVEIADPTTQSAGSGDDRFAMVFPFTLETPELLTVQRMGAAVPVLLILVEVSSQRVFFVCLNDYLDKVILPVDDGYARQKTKVLYIPERNELTKIGESMNPLRFYAKRAKLYSAFNRFNYQANILRQTEDEQLLKQAEYFARVLLRFDFWYSCDKLWSLIPDLRDSLVAFAATGWPADRLVPLPKEHTPGLDVKEWIREDGGKAYSRREMMQFDDVRFLWSRLSGAGRLYEEICREWFLPTPLGVMVED
jgi:hypothetical protein